MKKIICYIGLDVHKEPIAVVVAKELIYSLRSPAGAGK
jgi:hypothetical protein